MQLSVHEAARLLGVSDKTVYRWIQQGKVPGYRIGDQYRFNRAELLEWATAKRIQVSPEIFAEPKATDAELPSFVDALRVGGVFYRIGGTDKASVLRAVVETMRLPEEVDHEFLYAVLLARESLGSTGIGDGIAIPHVRNPIVLHIHRSSVTLSFLEHPIDFAAIDGKPVHTLFTIVSPTVRAHLHLLSRLSFVLRHPAFRQAIERSASREAIYEAARVAEASIPKLPNHSPGHEGPNHGGQP